MKIEKNKIVFGSVLAVILIFLISYSVLLMGDDEKQNDNLKQIYCTQSSSKNNCNKKNPVSPQIRRL